MRPQFKDKGVVVSRLSKLFTAVLLFTGTLSIVSQNEARAAESCRSLFVTVQESQNKQGALFIHERDSKLHMAPAVEKTVRKNQKKTGVLMTKPADKLNAWFDRLNRVSDKATTSAFAREKIKENIYNQYVMKPSEIPESYYSQQVRIARDRGHGDITLNALQRAELTETVIKDQQRSLDVWIEYLISKDTQIYPMWLKYWMFTGMTKLSKFDGEAGTFGNRSKETVAPYVEVNHEALAYIADIVVRKVNKKSLEDIQDPAFLKALEGVNFGKLYGQSLYKLGVGRDGAFASNEGQWVRYPRGSDHMPLVKSLEGRNTGWCTSGESTAQSQLRDGDFYVYYSRDNKGQNVIPRVAIRMEGDQIGEVRGVGKNQNLDSQISATSVVSDKMKTFGSKGDRFLRQEDDMKRVTAIDNKVRLGQVLTKDEIAFIYEFEKPILGFGHNKDPRIDAIRNARDIKDDYAVLLDRRYSKEEIAITAREFYSSPEKNFKVVVGDIAITEPGQKMPELLLGSLSNFADHIEGTVLPKVVRGEVQLSSIESARGIRFPEEVGGSLLLPNLRDATGAHLPLVVKGKLVLGPLKSIQGIELPREIGAGLNLYLDKAAGLKFPEVINGDLQMSRLVSAEGLKLPSTIKGNLDLSKLAVADGLVLPQVVGGQLYLNSLGSAKTLKMPKGIQGYKGPADIVP